MISSTFGGYMIAKLGLSAAQQGLYLTGQNLTNAGTKGYTRQRLDQVSINYGSVSRYASKYNPNIGNGVLVTGTSQLRDPFLDLRYRNEVAHTEEQAIKLDVLNDLRDILDEVKNAGDDSLGDGGIFNQIGDIIEKFQKYTSEIGSKEFDSMVKASCQSLVTLFNSYSKRIDEVEYNLNYDLENAYVPRVNSILKSIQELNKNIRSSEVIGQSALELKDERNLLIDELSEYMKIDVKYKPVNISPTTVVDELHISLVGQDGQNYEIIADEQRREFILSQDGDKTNLALGALSPIDQELISELNSAQFALADAQNRFDNRNETFAKAYRDLEEKLEEWNNRNQAVKDAQDKLGMPDKDGKYGPGLYKDMVDASNAYDEARKKYEDIPPADRTDADLEEFRQASKAKEEAVNKYNDGRAVLRDAEARVESYRNIYDTSVREYKDALADLDSNPKLPLEDNSNPPKQLLDTKGKPIENDLLADPPAQLKGEDMAANNLQQAKDRVKKALDALAQSEAKGAPVDSVNELMTDGKLKGALEMLNYSAEFDDPPNTIRGIGYYKNMLDTLANKFAEAMNDANNPYEFTVQKTGTDKDGNSYLLYTNYDYNEDTKTYTFKGVPQIDTNGSLVYDLVNDPDKKNPLGADGKPIYKIDASGNPIYDKDKNGQVIYINVLDANGDPVYEKNPDGSIKMETIRDENGNIVYEEDPNEPDGIKRRPMKDENGNEIKNPVYKNAVDKDGKPILDVDGNPVRVLDYETDANGDPVYELNDDGTPKLDDDGNPIRKVKYETVMEKVPAQKPVPLKIAAPAKEADMEVVKNEQTGEAERHDLFKSRDGGKITAGNIDLADGWVDNSYGITTALNENDPSGNNTNVLHFINMLNGKLNYKADVNLMDQVNIDFNAGGGATKEPSLAGMKNGDTIEIDGKTYTFVKGANGESGTEFSDLASLQNAASKNGVTVTENNGVLSAETAAQKFRPYDIKVKDSSISSVSQINVDGMKYGDTVEIDGITFTFKPATDPDGKQVADPTKNEFSSLASLKDLADKNNITITTDGGTPEKITDISKKAGEDVSKSIKVNKDPSINNMVTGNTITIGSGDNTLGTFTFVSPDEVAAAANGAADVTFNGVTFKYVAPDNTTTPPTITADPAKGEFSDLDTLKAAMAEEGMFCDADTLKDAAAKKDIDIYVDPDSGTITTVTKPGSKIFDGTFEEYYVNLDATLGLDIKHTTEKADNYAMLAGSISDEREAVTGVSHDEEAMNLMRYQQSYVAASRLMTTLDQVLDILLTQTGMVGR